MKKEVKAWAVIDRGRVARIYGERNGFMPKPLFRGILTYKKHAQFLNPSEQEMKVVPCTITYSLPPPLDNQQ